MSSGGEVHLARACNVDKNFVVIAVAAAPWSVKLFKHLPVCKVFCLLSCSYELHDGEELLVAVELLLLLQDQPKRGREHSEVSPSLTTSWSCSHEVVVETTLHHDPVDGSRQIDVCRQEHDVLSLQSRDALVYLHQVAHNLLQGALPLTGSTRAGARVGSMFACLLVV